MTRIKQRKHSGWRGLAASLTPRRGPLISKLQDFRCHRRHRQQALLSPSGAAGGHYRCQQRGWGQSGRVCIPPECPAAPRRGRTGARRWGRWSDGRRHGRRLIPAPASPTPSLPPSTWRRTPRSGNPRRGGLARPLPPLPGGRCRSRAGRSAGQARRRGGCGFRSG